MSSPHRSTCSRQLHLLKTAARAENAIGHFATGVTVVTSVRGDHEIVVGRVHDVETSGSYAAPLLYWRGTYLSLGEA